MTEREDCTNGAAFCGTESHRCLLSLSWWAAAPCAGSWFAPAGSRSSRRSRLWGGTSQKQTSGAETQFCSLKQESTRDLLQVCYAALTWTCCIQTQCAGSPRSPPPSWLSCWCQGRWPTGGRWARTLSPSQTGGELLSPWENTCRTAGWRVVIELKEAVWFFSGSNLNHLPVKCCPCFECRGNSFVSFILKQSFHSQGPWALRAPGRNSNKWH